MIDVAPADPNKPFVSDLMFNIHLAGLIENYWRERGMEFHAEVRPVLSRNGQSIYSMKSNMANGFPRQSA